ncbi:MAG: exosortase E/protease, VPEID-CTERM system [Hyphococcus sp.]
MSKTQTHDSAPRGLPFADGLGARAGLLVLLAAAELPFLAFLFDPLAINDTDETWVRVRTVLREGVPLTLFFLAALAILMTPQRRAFADRWMQAARRHAWRGPLAANLALFAFLAAATPLLNAHGAAQAAPPWGLFALWSAGAVGAYLWLALAAAPLRFWRAFINEKRALIALAAGAATTVEAAAVLSRQSWNALSEATFHVTAFILSLYESDVTARIDDRVIGVNDFTVNIAAACSGYEGVGLVLTFLAIYIWIFRSALRFPNIYLILPAGAAAIWVLNSVRIALLVSLGAHVSPEIAITGFHSQAGWMMFLIVTIGVMVLVHRTPFFHHEASAKDPAAPSPAAAQATALLAPFLAMTAAGIVAAAFTADSGRWLYFLRVAALALAVFAFWRFYRGLDWRAGWEPVLIGLGVGAAWIATDPGGETTLGPWLAALGPVAAAAWIAMRLAGTILLVPLAEELAFRGYLHKKLIADKFETVADGAFTWKAFVISTVLFGALHDRWLSGALAGAAFAIAMYRSGKLSGAVAAHMTANALIAFWAIAFGQWTLL